jgi:hypothetical protein
VGAAIPRTVLLAFAIFAASAVACPAPEAVKASDLHGLWRAEFDGLPHGATLLLEKHPEWTEGLAGGINRNGERGRVSAEIEDGEFVLEESADGRRIAAVWVGHVKDGSCGREISGTWTPDGQSGGRAFTLRKLP